MNEVETEIDVQNTSEQSGTDRVLILILRAAAFLCFAGWTWVHYYWEAPYGILLWQDATFEFASEQGVSWDEFIGTGTNDGWLQTWVSRITWLYFAFTIMTVTVRSKSYLQMAALIGGSGLLTVLSYAKYVASQRQLPMFLEHGGQMLAPILLVTALLFGARHRATLVVAMVALVMTFAGHGCYAVGWWPTPGNFYGMISLSLGVQYETANVMLGVFGILDFIVCIAIFLPYVRRWAIWYAVVWGFLTALARPVAGMSMSLNYWGADQYIHEAVLRAPHFLIPLYLAILWRRDLSATPTLAKPIPPSIAPADAVPAASA
ncbi:hypothetical protein SAMN06265222_11528 [Neorhodopirellula lusitana]|uniref:Uncharacterized protein n=1 Tax=Neorhodopirellula lusitana TaxID=445327 RepID=A0ABY1QLX1_9BACT|nr:hypothetical protein [Neorhodopirellula lusitana]SMP72260.1 hypothetical protein SAMN06265222_11528 [Neorhodopirellula lusitana]